MKTTQNVKRRSDEELLAFIEGLPGGNAIQYAKLLNTTSLRINQLMMTDAGQKRIVKKGLICIPERGKIPFWAVKKSERGALLARDIDDLYHDGRLPEFITNLLDEIHEAFREDALDFFKEALDQSANRVTFETQMRRYVDRTKHHTNLIVSQGEQMAERDALIAKLDQQVTALLNTSNAVSKLAGLIPALESGTVELGLANDTATDEDTQDDEQEAAVA